MTLSSFRWSATELDADGKEQWFVHAPPWAQSEFARQVWLEASAPERATIVRESLAHQCTPDEVILRREDRRLQAADGLGEHRCTGCGELLHPFSRGATCSARCRQRRKRARDAA